MPSVAVLPSAVADQIAAGEVVERPASVVKELIENALDAGATTISIEIEEGGRRAIRVSDDGSGMDRADAVLALERHATSKIRVADDLVGVRSFGFRGEALPAIASVSELTIDTASDDGAATIVHVRGSSVEDVRNGARRRGTTVSVDQLFFNTPARLKFLRTPRSEWRAAADAIVTLALTRPGVHFTVSHDGKSTMVLPPATSLRARVGAIWGAAYATGLLDVEGGRGEITVAGLVERPGDVGTRARRVHVAVNGRAIRDPGIIRAAEAAYRSTLPAGLRPSVLLDITVSRDTVDVNVHPAKAEVRFRDRWSVERVVESAVRQTLGSSDAAPALGSPSVGIAGEALAVGQRWANPFPAGSWRPAFQADAPPGAHSQTDAVDPALVLQGSGPRLVQLRRTYLLYERDDGLVLIDQHSAHERILYERFLSAMSNGTGPPHPDAPAVAAQRLLFPLTLHLNAAAADAFEANRAAFERLGFEAETFGGNSLVVHAVPVPHPRFDAERCLRDSLAALTGDRPAGAHGQHERLAATVACKAAIKAGDELAPAEMRALVDALEQTTLPAHDVHGRSTIVRLSWDEVERRFGRR